MYEKKQNVQLFTLVRQLGLFVPNEDYLGTILGYSVVGSQISFDTKTGSLDEVRFEEIKKVYSEMEEIIASYRSGSGTERIRNLQYDVNVLFESLKSQDCFPREFGLKSSLLERIMENRIRRNTRNFGESMRRSGLLLQNEINSTGKLSRTIDCLNSDYLAIEYSFDIGDRK